MQNERELTTDILIDTFLCSFPCNSCQYRVQLKMCIRFGIGEMLAALPLAQGEVKAFP